MRKRGVIFAIGFLALSFGVGYPEKSPRELTICCAGDSLMRPLPHHFRGLLQNLAGNVVINDWSRGGLSTRTYISFFRKHFKSRTQLSADFILLQLGTNDVASLHSGELTLKQFVQNLKTIIWEFKSINRRANFPAKVLLANIPPLYTPEYEVLNGYIRDTLNPAIKRTAEEEGVFLVDNWHALEDKRHLYDSDGVHPNAQGESVLAQNWVRFIRRASRSSKS